MKRFLVFVLVIGSFFLIACHSEHTKKNEVIVRSYEVPDIYFDRKTNEKIISIRNIKTGEKRKVFSFKENEKTYYIIHKKDYDIIGIRPLTKEEKEAIRKAEELRKKLSIMPGKNK